MKWVGGNSIFCCHRDILNDHLKPMDAHLRVTTKRQLGFTSRTDISGSNLESAFFLTTILEDNKVMSVMNVCSLRGDQWWIQRFQDQDFSHTQPRMEQLELSGIIRFCSGLSASVISAEFEV